MVHKSYLILAVFLLAGSQSFAQNEDDVLRYTTTYFGGSARNISLAGTIAGLGGDFTAVQTNPAALARIKKHTFTFTPYLEVPFTGSDFYGQGNSNLGASAKVGNISYVKAYTLDPRKFNNWFNVQLGIGYERVNSFETRRVYRGDADSSLLHSFANEANGTPQQFIFDDHPFRAGLAWDVFALDPGPTNDTYVPTFTNGKVNHLRSTDRKGGMGEYHAAISGNYANKLYVGGTFKASRVKFEESFSHEERYIDSSNWLNAIDYFGNLTIKGWGFGARIGAMYLPQDHIRIGLSFQTPTVIKLQDIWSNNMTSETDDGNKFVASEFVPKGKFDYRVKTPMRLNANFGYIYKKLGAISVEAEYVDYGNGLLKNISFSDNPADYTDENDQIDNIYTSAINLKLGLETRITAGTYLRLGYANYGSPYKKNKGNERYSTHFLTTGFGVNLGEYYIDLGYSLRMNKEDQFSYDPTINGSKVTYFNYDSRIALTFGLRLE